VGRIETLAKESGVSFSTAYRRLRAKGIYPKPRLELPHLELLELYKQGKSLHELAIIFRCDSSTIADRLRSQGLITRSHKEAMKLVGSQKKTSRSGSAHHNWNGGRRLTKRGYVLIYKPDHPRARGNCVFEHILIWEENHQHPLPEGWLIHHLNGVKSDNRPENLVATPSRNHADFIAALQNRIRKLEGDNEKNPKM
jgi:hypothetical protein